MKRKNTSIGNRSVKIHNGESSNLPWERLVNDLQGNLVSLSEVVIVNNVVLANLDVGLANFGNTSDAVTSSQDPVFV